METQFEKVIQELKASNKAFPSQLLIRQAD